MDDHTRGRAEASETPPVEVVEFLGERRRCTWRAFTHASPLDAEVCTLRSADRVGCRHQEHFPGGGRNG